MPDPKHIVILLICLNTIAFILFGIDKFLARSERRRISEKALLISSALMASPGGLLGMVLFNHKTSKYKFRFGMPVLLAAHAALVLWLAN